MNRRTALSALAAATVPLACLSPARAECESPMREKGVTLTHPKVLAVKFHADWCGSCKTIEPRFRDLHDKFDGKQVAFVTLDVTNRTKSLQAEMLAARLELDHTWKRPEPDTGFILVIDAQSGAVRDKLTKKHCIKQMSSAIDDALGRA